MGDQLTPKDKECVVDRPHRLSASKKDDDYFEETMARAMEAGRGLLIDDGVGCVVFAHKTTEGWESLIGGMLGGGLTVTASWPIQTERSGRLNAQEQAALATSVHLVCRPRPEEAPVGDWAEVLRELPKRIAGEPAAPAGVRRQGWMERLQAEGIRGADLIFACIGPALEIFSRYSRVETAEGREVTLAEYLEKVWEVVGRTALEQVLGTEDLSAGRQGPGASSDLSGTLEEDARLTALFLWTLQSTKSNGENGESDESESSAEDEGLEDEDETPRRPAQGFSLIFDVVRRFAQPLGIHLPEWEGRVVETKKGVVRLLAVTERAEQLFGRDGAEAVAAEIESSPERARQLSLFPSREESAVRVRGRASSRRRTAPSTVSDDSLRTSRGATTVDRVHAAMLLQKSGRANALRALLKAEQERGPDFLRLANALSALYPRGSEEKRLLDAMLLAVPK